jgi:hypothetical protein
VLSLALIILPQVDEKRRSCIGNKNGKKRRKKILKLPIGNVKVDSIV